MNSEHPGTIPGNALVVDPTKPFRPLSKFGNAFLNRFVCSHLRNEVLETVTFIDTPGILAGEKQRVDRGYEFTQVLEWFADRCDRILLLFDVSSLDISDELKRAIEVLRRNDDKIRIVLNKADSVDHQALMRVYGALMWSLGKVLGTPEVCRVYVGSFWSKPLTFDSNRRLFELETKDLFDDLGKSELTESIWSASQVSQLCPPISDIPLHPSARQRKRRWCLALESLPKTATLRKLNDLIKRARLAKVHALIISELKESMPSMFGKDSKRKDLINVRTTDRSIFPPISRKLSFRNCISSTRRFNANTIFHSVTSRSWTECKTSYATWFDRPSLSIWSMPTVLGFHEIQTVGQEAARSRGQDARGGRAKVDEHDSSRRTCLFTTASSSRPCIGCSHQHYLYRSTGHTLWIRRCRRY